MNENTLPKKTPIMSPKAKTKADHAKALQAAYEARMSNVRKPRI